MADPTHILEAEPLQLTPKLTYEEQPVAILDRDTQHLRTRSIDIVKVLWRSHDIEEATWELEETMRKKYPHLFGEVFQMRMRKLEFLDVYCL